GEAIICYQCNSEYDPRCGDPFDSYSLGTVNCSFQPRLEHLSFLEPTLCRKISQRELNISNELCNSSGKKDLNINEYESVLQQEPSIPENIPITKNRDNDDIVKNVEEDNTSNCVSSELNFVYFTNDNICINDNFVAIEEPILENKNIQESIQKSFISDKDLIQKYNLFKELKVILIKFDSLKNFNNEYSATEIEQIMDIYINSLTNFNLSKVQVHKRSLDEISSTSSSLKVNFEEDVQSTEYDLNSTIFETPNKNAIHAVAEETQNMIEPISALLENSSQNVIKNMELQPKKMSKTQKACHNLTEHFEDNSQKRFKQNIIGDLEQKSIVSTIVTNCALLSSSQKSTKKISSILSNINGNTIDIEKSANTLHTRSVIESINEMSSLNKEIESSSHKKDFTALITNVKSPEKMKVNTLNVINFKPYPSNENKKLLASGIKTFVSKTFKKTANITHPKKTTNKTASTCYSSIISPTKHKKFMDKKDSRDTTYKCIVCDLCFEDYSDLQPHLITHTQKQSNTLICSSKNFNKSSDKFEETILCSSEAKISGPSQTLEQNSIEHFNPSKTVIGEGNKQEKKKDVSKRLLNKEKKKKRIQSVSNSNECSICLKVFPTKPDLAAHIYLHTERELQEAYKLAKQKLNESGNSTVDNTIHINEKTQKVNDKEELLHIQKSNKPLITKDSEIRDRESNTVNENDLQSVELCSSLKSDKEKTNKIGSSKKSFTICECHNKPGTNENCLQIEIVLLCHTCRVLFRSMECFENHCRLPDHGKCNQNRFCSGRSPNLFCATCGMIFSSVQDVRHHLEIHARFKKNCRIDFRCNICKVIFLGIGTLFYIHWTKHARDPFWVANELSFPKYSVINTKLRKIDNLSTHNAVTSTISMEEYIQVAENVCYNCKLPFVTTDDLKKHVRRCNGIKSDQDTVVVENSSTSIQSHLTIKITCSLCNDTFTKRTEFYKHIKDKHNCNSDPQFVCISFTAAKVVFICSICMAIAENLDDFENHWLKHNITHVCFVCSQCSKTYRNNLNSFIEHGKEHKTKSDVLNCIVNYEKTKYICNFCNIGFDSSKSMREHNIIHKLNNQQTNSKADEVTNNASSASDSEVDCVSSFIATKELSVEKQPSESLHTETQVTEKINEGSLTRSNTDSDKEKLIKILEGSEDDSEHELIIDLTKHSEECIEPLRGEENKERQTSFNIKLDTSSTTQTCVISKNNITNRLEKDINIRSSPQNDAISENSQNIMPIATSSFTSKNVIPLVSSQDTNLNPQMSNPNIKLTNVSQNLHAFRNNVSNNNLLETEAKSKSDRLVMENVESIQNKVYDTDSSSVNQEESSIPRILPSGKKQSLLKPKSGFLRVKTLAELCGCTVEDTDNLIEHPKSDDGLIKNGKKHKIIEKELFPKQPADSIPGINKFGESSSYEKSIPSQSNTLPLSSSNVIYRKLLPKLPSTTNIINSQQLQQLQTNMTQNKHSSPSQIITSAYHKNLPACNIVRTTTAIPRSATLKNDITSIKVIANTANVSNAQKVRIASGSENKSLTSFVNSINLNDPYKYKCKFCNFRSNDIAECLMHNLPGTNTQCGHNNQRLDNENLQTVTTTNILPNNPNRKQYQQTITNQSGIKCASSPIISYQYPYLAAGSSNSNSNTEVLKQNQQITTNQQIAGSASSSIYYKNPNHSTGGMSIVINQTAPPVQNIPTIGIMQQPAQQQIYQPRIYQPQIYNSEPVSLVNTSYIEQSQVYWLQ
ncbi:hypothetical protein WN48_08796, partial [Eufriesea mexicana]